MYMNRQTELDVVADRHNPKKLRFTTLQLDLLMMFDILNALSLVYLTDLLKHYSPSVALHSSDAGLLLRQITGLY